MARYVADTHALVWYLTGSPHLSSGARQVFDDAVGGAHEILVSVIVLAELVMMAEKQRIVFNLASIMERLQSVPTYHLLDLTPSTVLRIQSLPHLPDIHDRLIVATALEAGATIITRDWTISRSRLAPVVW